MIAWVGYAAALALLVALAPLPYAYYSLLRVAITVAAAAIASHCFRTNHLGWAWLMVFLALLFNPIEPVPLGRQVWMAVDAMSAFVFVLVGYRARTAQRRAA